MRSHKPAQGAARQRSVRQLSDLQLTAEELDRLGRQGTVCAERRREQVYYKLRFRQATDGRQMVRYIGRDKVAADTIRAEVRELQAGRQHSRALRRLEAAARGLLRTTKRETAATLAVLGYHYHGLAIRKRRSPRGQDQQSADTDR